MATSMESTAARGGTFCVTLQAIKWTRRSGASSSEDNDDAQPRAMWALVQVEHASGQLLDGIWFGADDENVMTRSVVLPQHGNDDDTGAGSIQLEYMQSSRPVVLTKDSLVALLNAQLKVSLFSGETRSRTSDELWGEACVAFMPAVIGERLHTTVRVTSTTSAEEEISVELHVQCDADLSDFTLGARVLRIHSLEITNPPKEWTPTSDSDDDAVKACATADRNAATYELELQLPDWRSGNNSATVNHETVTFGGGKLTYEPQPGRAVSGDNGAASGLSGVWRITFPSAIVHKLYLKPSVRHLVDFVHVEKSVTGLLRRASPEPVGRITASLVLNLSPLVTPGQTRLHGQTPFRKITPLPKETLEQELAAATSNDEKKRLQVLVNDYDAAVAQPAVALSHALRRTKTRVECVVEVLGNGPLVPEPPPTVAPAKTIDELVTPRDLSDEYDQRKDTERDLRTEIRRVVLTVLREYEDVDGASHGASTRDDKRQRIVFQINSQGAYHEFKEKLKKRIVPLIRDQFADELMDPSADSDVRSGTGSGDAADAGSDQLPLQPQVSRTNSLKKSYFAKLYATLMDEVQRVLHETFYASSPSSSLSSSSSATLEKTHADLQPRDDAKITLTLTTLGQKALENYVNGDVEKCEALHRDRIAFAEARAVEMPLGPALSPSLATVWLDYAMFCLTQRELDKAGGALRQCLSLEPHSVVALVALGALLCELQDFTSAETVIKNAVQSAITQVAHTQDKDKDKDSDAKADALHLLVTAHGLLALLFAQSGQDKTGNLVLFELLNAQRTLRQWHQRNSNSQPVEPAAHEPSLSAAWIHVASHLHALPLHHTTLTCLELADQYHHPRDVLSREERVLKRVILAEHVSLRGEGDRATTLLQEALEIDRSHAFAWLALGKTYLQLESQTSAAIECLQHSLVPASQHTLRVDQRLAAWMHLGLVLLQSSQFALAKATFLSACEDFPLASTWLGVGIACVRLEDWDAAHTALAEANRLDNTNPEVWGYMALLALSATSSHVTPQLEQRATQYATQAVRLELTNPVLLRELSSGFVAIDRLELAERLLRRALVFQDSSLTRKTLADILAAQNCAEDALAQYKQSLDESRDLVERGELLDKCAALLVTLGRPEEAAECRNMANQLQDLPFELPKTMEEAIGTN